VLEQLEEKRALVAEVVVDRANAHTSFTRYVTNGRTLVSILSEEVPANQEQPFAGLDTAGLGLARRPRVALRSNLSDLFQPHPKRLEPPK
jgi:hypothetical protein